MAPIKLPFSLESDEEYSSSSDSDSSSNNSATVKISLPTLFELGCKSFAAPPNRTWTCENCGMAFNKSSALAEHMRGSHPAPAPPKQTSNSINSTKASYPRLLSAHAKSISRFHKNSKQSTSANRSRSQELR